MAASSLLALIDDIATLLDDVAVMFLCYEVTDKVVHALARRKAEDQQPEAELV